MFWVGKVSLVLFFLEGYTFPEALGKVPQLNWSENLGKNPLRSSLSHGWLLKATTASSSTENLCCFTRSHKGFNFE